MPLPVPVDPPYFSAAEDTPKPAFAHYAQLCNLCVCHPFEPVPISSIVRETCDTFLLECNTVNILRRGTYMATFTLNMPANSIVNTQITMALNGMVVDGSTLNIAKDGGAPSTATFQCVVEVYGPCALLEIISSHPFSLDSCCPTESLASLTLVEIV